eukprot:scaffold35033_cov54-Phaeocystis_antarctica.AAC.1
MRHQRQITNGGVAHSLAPPVELTGGAARLPAVGAKNWPFGTLVAAELVLTPRFMLSPISCLFSGKKEKAWSSKSAELKAYDVVVKVRGGEDSGEGNGEREMSTNRAGCLKGLPRGTGLVQHALLVAGRADLVQHLALFMARHDPINVLVVHVVRDNDDIFQRCHLRRQLVLRVLDDDHSGRAKVNLNRSCAMVVRMVPEGSAHMVVGNVVDVL